MKALRLIGGSLAGTCIYLAGACGGQSSNSTDEAAPIGEAGFGRKLASAVCDNLMPCCTRLGIPFNRERCRQALEHHPINPPVVDSLVYNADRADECIALARKAAETCQSPSELPAICRDVYRGTRTAGEPCSVDDECAASAGGSARCYPSIDGTPLQGRPRWMCIPETRGVAGDLCNSTCTEFTSDFGCGGMLGQPVSVLAYCYTSDGLYCQSETDTCLAQSPLGSPCHASEACVAGTRCDGGICSPQTELGGACSVAGGDDDCKPGLYCDTTHTFTCVRKRANGESCVTSGECEGKCTAIGVCAALASDFADTELCGSAD